MNDSLKELLKTHLANAENRIPNSASARLSRTFLTGMRTGRLLLFRKKSKLAEAEIDLKALSKIVGAIGELKASKMILKPPA
ncbi:hypothetical protein KAI87_02205 [Myxococcota bacterium]|nr:hypothetical protein [Myxococcota bacterium]